MATVVTALRGTTLILLRYSPVICDPPDTFLPMLVALVFRLGE